MLSKIEQELQKYDSEIGDKLNILKIDHNGKIPVAEIEQVYKMMNTKEKDDEEKIKRLISKLDTDNDGMIDLQEILKYAKEMESNEQEGHGTVSKEKDSSKKTVESVPQESSIGSNHKSNPPPPEILAKDK